MPIAKNILIFFTDDHAQWAAGAYGNPELQGEIKRFFGRYEEPGKSGLLGRQLAVTIDWTNLLGLILQS